MKTLKDLFGGLDNKKIILIVIFGLLFLFLDFSLIKIQLNANKKLKVNIVKLKKDTDTLNQDLKKMEELRKKFAVEGKRPASRLKKLVSEQELTYLLQYISSAAKDNDVQISQMKPAKQSAASDAKKRGADKAAPSNTLSYSINMDITCGYHELGKFINSLENGEIFIEAKSIKITPQPQDVLKQKVNLNLLTYVKK